MYAKEINIDEIVAFTNGCGPDTRIYIGCDSERFKMDGQWWADYITAVVIHIDGNNGCKIFGAVNRERDYDQAGNKPRMRLMNEVYRVADLYIKLSAEIDLPIEVHLDLNPDDHHQSNVVINEAVGYIRGMCNVIPMVKPNSFAASNAADRFKYIVSHKNVA